MYSLYTHSHLFTVYRFYSGEAILRPQAKLYSGRYRAKQHTTSKIIFSLCVCMCESEAVSSVYTLQSRGEYLDEIQTKVLRVFLLAIHSQLYSFALIFLFLQTHANLLQFLQSMHLLYSTL